MKLYSKVLGLLLRKTAFIRNFLYLIVSENPPQKLPRISSPVYWCGTGKLDIAPSSTWGYLPSALFFSHYTHVEARYPEDIIRIGDNTVINNGANIVAAHANIFIGKNCLIGIGFTCYSSDFHGLGVDRAKDIKSADVFIGDNVFIGSGVTVLKGTHIGNNCTIGAGSVVHGKFPDNVIISGNPAKIIASVPHTDQEKI